MKKMLLAMSLAASTSLVMAESGFLDLPSSVPIEVFKMK